MAKYQTVKTGQCKCIQIPTDSFYNQMLFPLQLEEIYNYEIYMELADQGEGNWGENFYYNVFTPNNQFIMGGLEVYFSDTFIDLMEWRARQLRQILN